MSRADSFAVNDKAVQDFVLDGEVTEAEIAAGAAQGRKWLSLRRFLVGFFASITPNGYIAFPLLLGGWIIQWGTVEPLAVESTYALSFPLAFPKACFGGLAVGTRATAITGGVGAWYFANPTKNGATLVNDGSSGATMGAFWISIGN